MFHESKGIYAPQAHVAVPEGTFEDEHGRQGFSGRATHLYHKNPPTNWTKIEGPCKPQCFNAIKAPVKNDPWQSTVLLQNEDIKIGIILAQKSMPYHFRNGDGDNIYFIHQGQGHIDTDFGPLDYTTGDYIVVPKGTTIKFETKTENKILCVEAKGEVNLPDKGLLGRHALFDLAMLKTPTPAPRLEKGNFELKIKRQETLTSVFYDFNPLDVVGWKGDLCVTKINIKDFRPVMSHRYHLAPSVHSTFVGSGFVLCSFVPRPFEQDPQAERVPFYHRNIDSDEVIFYHAGDFFSRKNMGAGMITFHPFGIHHGPHPGAKEGASKKTETNEYAVMVDTFRPLNPTEDAKNCEWADYHLSWRQS